MVVNIVYKLRQLITFYFIFSAVYTSCKELRSVYNSSGVYSIKPFSNEDPIQVMCDMETDDGGWIVSEKV